MSEPFIGEIRMFAGNFAPRNWAFCDGQLMPVNQNDALFSLLGVIYGGDGRSNFAMPDLRGRIPLHKGQAPGLYNYRIGQKVGEEMVNLSINEMPSHTHGLQGTDTEASASDPTNSLLAKSQLYSTQNPNSDMKQDAITNTGGGNAHYNVQPFVCVNFIISLFGVYPSRS